MNLTELEIEFSKLGENYKTKDKDNLNKRLIKQNTDVSFLKDIVLEKQKYHRTYFQVSMGNLKTYQERFEFIEDNFDKLQDWWHVDQLTQFIGKSIDFSYAFNKSKEYVNHKHPFARRWGYVLFMPTLVKEENAFELIVSLLKNDDHYYVIMAEAWLISYLAIYHPTKTYEYLKTCDLSYELISKSISKICDSFRVSDEYKDKVRKLRELHKGK